ncbi:MAG: hypothetical protein A2X94_09625 [Bdellovibrionales bacterium GWB1_55_8]|nr:MAG: hypothetical protein A2X94_09625 [Bdellovibrionales bacterium GWB1_55_8]
MDPATIQVAEGMEAMFVDYMMKVMRETVPENEMSMSSPATKIYQSMLDSEYAQKAARAGGFGLADQVIAYLESQRYTQRQGRLAPPAKAAGVNQGAVHHQDPTGSARPTGGTNEGQFDDSSPSANR